METHLSQTEEHFLNGKTVFNNQEPRHKALRVRGNYVLWSKAMAVVILFAVLGKAGQDTSTVSAPGPIRTMHLFSSGSGWIVTGNRLLWTETWGDNWDDITPSLAEDASIDGVFFQDAHGWTITHRTEQDPTELTLYTTADKGKSWSAIPFPITNPYLRSGYAGQSEITFLDALHGWALLKQTSSSASSFGILFITADGGRTWSQLPVTPVAGKMLFSSPATGWLVGGVRTQDLYQTKDGGQHWAKQSIPIPNGFDQAQEAVFNLPHFTDPNHALLSVTFLNSDRSSTTIIYSSSDAGKTWQALQNHTNPLNRAVRTFFEDSHTMRASLNNNRLTTWGSDGIPHTSILPISPKSMSGIMDMQFGDSLHGWLHISGTQCTGFKTGCSSLTALLKTSDGGLTFVPLLSHAKSLIKPQNNNFVLPDFGPNPYPISFQTTSITYASLG